MALLGTFRLAGDERSFRDALPGYTFQFPRDHFAHPDFRTEWWYYTGTLAGEDGSTYGFELTFFRQALPASSPSESQWRVDDIYAAHFAVTSIGSSDFVYDQRMQRPALGLAGASTFELVTPGARIWIRNWSVEIQPDRHVLHAASANMAIDLELYPRKPPVIHGVAGISRKGPRLEDASHYYSFTRLAASGTLRFRNKNARVTGQAWMDHEFGSGVLPAALQGWDWFCLQFDDNTELMLGRLRDKEGRTNPYSAGTYVDAAGLSQPIAYAQFELQPNNNSTIFSEHSGATYPREWQLKIPSLQLEVRIDTATADQELDTRKTTGVIYYEGAATAVGQKGDAKSIHFARGYVELTGYAPRRSPR